MWSCGALCAQEDEYRFNRGWLLNAGIAAARLTDGCDTVDGVVGELTKFQRE